MREDLKTIESLINGNGPCVGANKLKVHVRRMVWFAGVLLKPLLKNIIDFKNPNKLDGQLCE